MRWGVLAAVSSLALFLAPVGAHANCTRYERSVSSVAPIVVPKVS